MADQPTVAADRAQPLPVAEALRDRGCADVVAVVVSNLPPGAALSAGVDNGDGSWSLAVADLDALAVAPPADWVGELVLTVIATSRDPAAGAPATTTAFGLTLAFGPPPSAVAVAPPAAGIVDGAPAGVAGDAGGAGETDVERTVALDIDVGLSADDVPGPISVAIGGLPAGAALSAGADDGTGTWVLEATALAGLALTLPAGAPDRLTLGIAATAADGSSATGVLSLVVSELPDAPPEPLSPPEVGPEPRFEAVYEFEPEPGVALDAEPEAVSEPVFTPEYVPEFVTDYEPDAAPSPPPSSPAVAAPPTGTHVPVAYWKLDEPLPGAVGDEIAGHHGRAHGVEKGAGGGAFDSVDCFDGIDDYLVVPHAPDLAPAAGTLTVWFNAFAGGQAAIAAKGAPDAGAYAAFAVAGRRLRFIIGDGAATHVAQGGAFGAAEWNQATATWGAAGMALYLNGELVAADDYAGGLADDGTPWLFGAAGNGEVGDFFHGELDDIALYAEQFDAAAARRLFQLGVIGLMNDGTAGADAPVAAAGDAGLDLDAIPTEAEGPVSLAVLDVEDDDRGDGSVGVEASEDAAAGGDSPLDLDAIPAEAEGPESLATLDVEDEGAAEEMAAAEPVDADDRGVFVFGPGGDYFQGGDGWSDTVPALPADDAPAVRIAAAGELTLAGGDKLEW